MYDRLSSVKYPLNLRYHLASSLNFYRQSLSALIKSIQMSFTVCLALLLALVSHGNVRQAKVPMFEAPSLSRGIVHNVCVCAEVAY